MKKIYKIISDNEIPYRIDAKIYETRGFINFLKIQQETNKTLHYITRLSISAMIITWRCKWYG